jgi:glycosyltransferase involved in cell wall biosynthesis
LTRTHRFELVVVGDGHARTHAQAQINSQGFHESVRLLGWLQHEAVEEQLAAADVFVLPSWQEGLPNAMIEAMSAALAIVVTAVGNIPDTVAHEREALLVPPRHVDALHSALVRVLDDASLRRRLGEAAFRLAKRQFSVEQAVDRLLAAVDDCAPQRDGATRSRADWHE